MPTKSNHSSSGSTLSEYTTPVLSALVAVLVVAFAYLLVYVPTATECGARYGAPVNHTSLASLRVSPNGDQVFHIVVITDLDNDSKHPTKKNTWFSLAKTGDLTVSADGKKARVAWNDDAETEITSQIAAGGRAMELSDLAVFDGNLIAVDDRTGILYRLTPPQAPKQAIPWLLLNDGPGNVTKGFKGEWLTVKGDHLIAGGLGKEWTTTDGVFQNYHPMYVKQVGSTGAVEHVNWVENYKKLRRAVGIEWPGYMIHEAGQWSDVHQKWFFMPRRASKDSYTEATDEFAGTDLLLIASEDFSHVEARHVGDRGTGAPGFSAFAFVPGSNDDLIVALKSEEKNGVPVASYITVFRFSNGAVLLEEQALNGAHKYEGVAFV